MSKYRRTMELLLRFIDEEGLRPGDRLPPEPDLVRISGVSMITVRRAIAELAARGVVVRQQGRGTFVARARLISRVALPGSLRTGMGNGQVPLRSHVVRFEKNACAPRAARFLQIGAQTLCWEIVRVRFAEGPPLLIDRAIIPVVLAPGLRADDLEGDSSLYDILAREHDLVDVRDEQVLSVVVPVDEERSLLQLGADARLVAVEGASFTAANSPFAYFRLLFDADRFSFRIDGEQALVVPIPYEEATDEPAIGAAR